MAGSKKISRRPIPYAQIATMWREGKTYEEMAKAMKRFNPKSDDPTKPMRAIVSLMLTRGYKNADGKIVKLPPRKNMRNRRAGADAKKQDAKVAK